MIPSFRSSWDQSISIYDWSLEWCVTLDRFDINFAVMSMSRFRIEPCEGHMEKLKRFYGYLRKNPEAKIKFRTGVPTKESFFKVKKYDWMF